MSFHKATKLKAKLRLALCGLAGSGKTFSALAIATALSKMIRAAGHGDGRIAVIDSERGSASLYADLFNFDVDELKTFSPLAYVDKIHVAEDAGYDIIIADSISHAWAGKDGALDQKDQAADRGGNSWTAWRQVTPKHTALVDALVGSRSHIIATMRTKMEYVQEVVDGKTQVKKIGLAAIQREGMEYEFTLVGDLDLTHALRISKTRCDGCINTGDLFEKPGENFAHRIYGWLMSGADSARPALVADPPAPPFGAAVDTAAAIGAAIDETFAAFTSAMESATSSVELDRVAGGPGKPARGTPQYDAAVKLYLACKARIATSSAGAAARGAA